jgi:hypothetical protein
MDEDTLEAPKVILTPKEVLDAGLKLVHYTEGRIERAQQETNTTRFKSFYGCNPIVAAQIFEDLQTSPIAEASRLDESKISLFYFLQALNFLY